ncbi:hypothetical protein LUQ84_002518 [Hamiltosporidium tvaerminnensis]|nr:hypothetical protein LUQ84_002518 [Hamiltosporidium tvaerminnensis]
MTSKEDRAQTENTNNISNLVLDSITSFADLKICANEDSDLEEGGEVIKTVEKNIKNEKIILPRILLNIMAMEF